jgi:sugar phosphate isomerase/epimerase
MRYGVVLHGAGVIDGPTALAEMAAAGFTSFEYSYSHLAKVEALGETGYRELADHASKLGLEPVQIHGPSLEQGFDLGSPEDSVRKRSIRRSCRWMDHCATLGAPVMIEHGCEFHDDFQETMDLVKSSFRTIARSARDRGLRIAIENEFDPRNSVRAAQGRCMVVPARVGCTIPELMEVINDVDPDTLGICLDFGHANLQRPLFGLAEALAEAGRHLIATHIHDNEGLRDDHMFPLMGNIEWDAATDALRRIPYRKPLILEADGILSVKDRNTRMNRLRAANLILRGICGVDVKRGKRSA